MGRHHRATVPKHHHWPRRDALSHRKCFLPPKPVKEVVRFRPSCPFATQGYCLSEWRESGCELDAFGINFGTERFHDAPRMRS